MPLAVLRYCVALLRRLCPLAGFHDVRLDAWVPRLPGCEVDVQVAPGVALIRGTREVDLELMSTGLLGDAVCPPEKVLQVAKRRWIADVHMHSRRSPM
jgi:hypothetical protein